MLASNAASSCVRLPCAGLMDVQHHAQLQSQVPRVMHPSTVENLTGTASNEMTTRKTRPAMQTRKLDCVYVFLVSISHTRKLSNLTLCWRSECLPTIKSLPSKQVQQLWYPVHTGTVGCEKTKTKHRGNFVSQGEWQENPQRPSPVIIYGNPDFLLWQIWNSSSKMPSIQRAHF